MGDVIHAAFLLAAFATLAGVVGWVLAGAAYLLEQANGNPDGPAWWIDYWRGFAKWAFLALAVLALALYVLER